ncbi:hypothetical protein GOP47_0011933 [Adiantum capillus-veneris]|uniref:Uncharacterized protein n=1 Tax=Adiantum capillus-veneris TaxID=13818 RepID=A0A9D4UTP2_ADICA|nr:hypothetical protein GOP47_0011933 [Adiantum capillus-veneris]
MKEMNLQQKQGMKAAIDEAASVAESISTDDVVGAIKEIACKGARQADKQLESLASTTTTTTMRRMSAESQDFEFNKVMGRMASTDGGEEGEYKQIEMPSADELFYKGQLLPLAVQYNKNSSINIAWAHQHHLHLHDSPAGPASINNTINASASGSPPTHPAADDHLPNPFEPFSSQLVCREQDVRFSSSCRMELAGQLDYSSSPPSLFHDLRSSSFRSHSSKYSSYYCHYYANYGSSSNCSSSNSGDSSTAGAESSSSSRDSNGSSQDSHAAAPAPAFSTSYPSDTLNNMNSDHHLCCSSSCSHCPKRKHLGFLQSWRLLLLHGFKRGSSSTHDDHEHDHHHHQAHHNSSKSHINHSLHGGLQRPANLSYSAELIMDHHPNRGLSASLACGCKLQDYRKGCIKSVNDAGKPKSSSGTGLMEKEVGMKKELSSRDKQSEVKESSSTINYNGAINSNNSKGSKWQRRIKPNISMIKARLVGGNHGQLQEKARSHDQEQEEERGWSSSTTKRRVTRKLSLDRKFSQPALCESSGKTGLSNVNVSFRFHGGSAGAASSSSCPASVRSSPNHSGLLSPVLPTSIGSSSSSMSTMQELHSAVQGAIAHCKQSVNSANTSSHINPILPPPTPLTQLSASRGF